MREVKNDVEIKAATKIARRVYKRGLNPDKIRYSGPNGNFTMAFDGEADKYVLHLLPDYSNVDWDGLYNAVCKGRKK